MRQFVSVILVKPDGSVLSQHRDNIPTILGPDTWCTPGGALEPTDLSLKYGAARELKEETGIIAGNWDKIMEVEMSASVIKSPAHIFIARQLKFEDQNLDHDEEISLVKISLDEAIEKVVSGEIKTGSTIIGILMIDKLRREGKL